MAFYLSCIRWWLLLLPAAVAVWLFPAAFSAYVRFYCQIGFKGAECWQLSLNISCVMTGFIACFHLMTARSEALKDQRRRAARLAQ